MSKRKIILVTDGDRASQKAIEVAAANIGGRCISVSGGNPTVLKGSELVDFIKRADHDPVVVMVDDKGKRGIGRGEKAMAEIMINESIEVLGVVAVSSNGKDCNGLNITCSVTKEGRIVEGGVDKFGNEIGKKGICGDTLSVLRNIKDLVIIGIGDPGKMDYYDDTSKGAPITTKALQEILNRSNFIN
jgi:stage V sporulation protein AE